MFPLHSAARSGDVAKISLLADDNCRLNGLDEDGWTPSHFAARFGRRDAVKLLVSRGADRNVKAANGETPLSLTIDKEIQNLLKGSSHVSTSELASLTSKLAVSSPAPTISHLTNSAPLPPAVSTSMLRPMGPKVALCIGISW